MTYLSRIFKHYTRMTVHEYLTDTRIAHTQTLLAENRSVTETYFLCGFNDCSDFIKTFRHLTGKTPLQFQKQLVARPDK